QGGAFAAKRPGKSGSPSKHGRGNHFASALSPFLSVVKISNDYLIFKLSNNFSSHYVIVKALAEKPTYYVKAKAYFVIPLALHP
ncbi:MAG: hypothetical protein LBF22_08520, partial [Deltaproteobacteria bacterium]|nr:hypothetical protein [Deltaproteobacteria bacterium]